MTGWGVKMTGFKKIRNYVMIGGLAAAVEYTSFLVIYSVLPYVVMAQSLSFVLGIIVSFTGSRQYTFNNQRAYHHSAKTQIISYLSLAFINLLISNLLIYVLVHGVVIIPLVAKIIVMGCVALWNFVIFNRFVFKTK